MACTATPSALLNAKVVVPRSVLAAALAVDSEAAETVTSITMLPSRTEREISSGRMPFPITPARPTLQAFGSKASIVPDTDISKRTTWR